jgi:hypothetical protein
MRPDIRDIPFGLISSVRGSSWDMNTHEMCWNVAIGGRCGSFSSTAHHRNMPRSIPSHTNPEKMGIIQ